MIKIDIHVHTTASTCSIFHPRDLVSNAIRMHLPAVVTTNHHDSYGDSEFLKNSLELQGILYFPALEITNHWGDFLLFGENLENFQGYNWMFPKDKIPRDDIAVIWAHPFRFMSDEKVNEIKWEVYPFIDAIEGINGNCLFKNNNANHKAIKLAEELKKPVTAGSDAHAAVMFFMAWTEFTEPIKSYPDFVRSIKKGKFKFRWKKF